MTPLPSLYLYVLFLATRADEADTTDTSHGIPANDNDDRRAA